MTEGIKKTSGYRKKIGLALVAALIVPMAVEFGLRGLGVGESPRLLTQTASNGEKVWVDAPFFTRPFFGPGLSRESAPLRIPVDKSEDELRIVVLGGSAAMGDPMSEFGLSRHLESFLQPAFPDRTVRVVNLAMTAINSHVVRRIARESLRLDPDIMVIYMGNNEVVGPFGPGTIFSGFYSSPQWIRLAIWVRSLRLGQGLASITVARSRGTTALDEWGGMEMFLEGRITEDDPRLSIMRSHFRTNLEDILRLCRRHQVIPVVSTIAVNLDAFPPFLPSHPPDDFADGKYKQGEGDREAAWSHFQRASDRDQLRFRADSQLNELLRNLSEEEDHRDVVWVDAAEHFRQRYLEDRSGDEWFVDHVHFSFKGNVELARIIARDIIGNLTNREDIRLEMSEADLRPKLGYSPWAERLFHNMMGERYLQLPFNQQAGQVRRIADWMATKNDLDKAIEHASLTEWLATLDRVLALNPADAEMWMWRAGLAHQADDLTQARDDYLRVIHLLPHRSEPITHWVTVLADLNGPAYAGEALLALPVDSRLKGKALRSAGILAERKKLENTALALYSLWHELDPSSLDAMARVGHLHTLTGNPERGLALLNQVRANAPTDRRLLAYLGTAYQALGQTKEAIAVYNQAASYAMGDPVLLGFVSGQLRRLGDEEGALTLAQRAWTLNPSDVASGFHVMDHAREVGDVDQALDVLSILESTSPDRPAYRPLRAILLSLNQDLDAALEILTTLVNPTPLERALQVWLVVSSEEGRQNGIDPARLQAVLASPIFSYQQPELGLILPAILADRGRFSEAGQHLQLVQIHINPDRPRLQIFANKLDLAIHQRRPVTISPEHRAHDPVLATIWHRIGGELDR